MDLETENRIATILLKEANELRRQAQSEGALAYLGRPTARSKPNSRFLTATVLGVQQEKLFVNSIIFSGYGIWRSFVVNFYFNFSPYPGLVVRTVDFWSRNDGSSMNTMNYYSVFDGIVCPRLDGYSGSANRAVEVNEMWRLREKQLELDNRLERTRNGSSSRRNHEDGRESCSSRDCTELEPSASASLTSKKRTFHGLPSVDDEGLKDDEIEEFLHSRTKRGRGAVGSRMDETGPYLPPSLGSANIDEEPTKARSFLGPERPFPLKSKESSDDDSLVYKKQKAKRSSKNHSSKHKSKNKREEKKRKH
ncbi:hypothetical protein ACJIZ3_015613 [Penstemon smallii]|uniref:Uncharacterized protein n=1 Tax=Penstemon smallii TaxID=265156 RepID=A0ABD3RN44_9LAMI